MAEKNKPADKPKANEAKVKKARVRKTETQRELSAKNQAKAQAKANKQPKRRVRGFFAKLFKPFKKPLYILATPFRTRPVRFVGRVLGRIFWPRYFRNAYKEVRLVTWPTRSETWKLTFAVIIFAIGFGLLAAGTDFVLDKIIRRIVFRT